MAKIRDVTSALFEEFFILILLLCFERSRVLTCFWFAASTNRTIDIFYKTSRKLSCPPICIIKYKKLVKIENLGKMTKSQLYPAPSMNQNKKTVESNQLLIKMNFGAKNFFWKKSKSNIPPPPRFSPKNASMVVIPTENGQTVQFQVLKHLFLSSAPWKTTKKTYISIIRQIWKNSPEKGCF